MTFDDAAWQSGVLRDSIPAALDRCDFWQPHQVLLESLTALLGGIRRPRDVLVKLDARGPLHSAAAALVGGTLWLYLLFTAMVSTTILIHTGVSPAAAMRSAALCWAPAVLVVSLVPAALTFGIVGVPNTIRVVGPTWREYFRLAGFWTPVAAAYAVVPLGAALLACPDFVLGLRPLCPLLTGIPALLGLRGCDRAPGAAPGSWRRIIAIWSFIAWVGGSAWFADRLIPTSIEPPAWTYEYATF